MSERAFMILWLKRNREGHSFCSGETHDMVEMLVCTLAEILVRDKKPGVSIGAVADDVRDYLVEVMKRVQEGKA